MTPRAASPLVLGIESSCDDMAAAVLRDGREILSSSVHGQNLVDSNADVVLALRPPA